METITPIKTPNTSGHLKSDNVLSTPLFVPPTPMLKELGYGTGKSFNFKTLLYDFLAKTIIKTFILFWKRSSHLSHRTVSSYWNETIAMGGEAFTRCIE